MDLLGLEQRFEPLDARSRREPAMRASYATSSTRPITDARAREVSFSGRPAVISLHRHACTVHAGSHATTHTALSHLALRPCSIAIICAWLPRDRCPPLRKASSAMPSARGTQPPGRT